MTQNEKVLEYMKDFGSITHKDAVVFLNIMDVHKCISALEKLGFIIERNWKERVNKDGKKVRWKEYRLVR